MSKNSKNNYTLIIFFAFFAFSSVIYFSYVLSAYTGSDGKWITIAYKELKEMSAQEFIEIMQNNKVVSISGVGEKYINDWPKNRDINYLLSVVDSEVSCGILWWSASGRFPTLYETKSSTKQWAITLLKAINEGSFNTISGPESEIDQEKIIE